MEAETRRETAFTHCRGASSPQGDPVIVGSTRTPQMTAYRQQALVVANALADMPSCRGTFGCWLQTPPNRSGQRLWLVRADRAWNLRTDFVGSHRPCHMGRTCSATASA